MAVIAISRQVAALGDEIAEAAAKKLNYSFINRKEIERRIISLGFPEEVLKNMMSASLVFLRRWQKSGMNILIICRLLYLKLLRKVTVF